MKTYWIIGLLSLFISAHSLMAGAFFEGKTVLDPNYEVNVSIMRWGNVDRETDRIMGQIISDNHQSVALVFEYTIDKEENGQRTIDKGKKGRLTIDTGTHVFGKWREHNFSGPCAICRQSRLDNAVSAKAKGAKTSGGCFFQFDFPRVGTVSKMQLVNVLVGGKSVNYITKFNISAGLLRSPMQVPMSKSATLHLPVFKFEEIELPLAVEK